MTTPHKASAEQWARLEHHPGLHDTCLLELRARVEALEATQHTHPELPDADPTAPAPAGSLVERVADAIDKAPYDLDLHQWDEARAALREVAAAARFRDLDGQSVAVMTWEMVAQWLEQEAFRG